MAHYTTDEMIRIIGDNQEIREKLFCRGYLVTSEDKLDINEYPFWGNWNHHRYLGYNVFVHKNQHIFSSGNSRIQVFLIGNAIDPFDMVYDESVIVESIFSRFVKRESFDDCIDYINQLTGSFFIGAICGDKLQFVTDPTEMLFSSCGILDGHLYISSHPQMIGDICHLTINQYIKELENYRFFYKYGVFFPGAMTQFNGVERVLTNHIYIYEDGKLRYYRFFPTEQLIPCNTDKEYKELVAEVSKVLKNTLVCASKKWNKPAISLTGGMDSKTTLSASKGLESKFYLYSYITMPGDRIDAEAAHSIAESLGVPHTVLEISDNNGDFENYDVYKAVIEHNFGDYNLNLNDVRKRIYFNNTDLFDVEIKSWISEIARANYYKKFGLKKMPHPLTPRNMTSMYKVFLSERSLAKQTDQIFEKFIEDAKFNEIPEGYDPSDMYLWEFRYSAWGGLVITCEHSFSYEIFIPYNNRLLLNLMLKAPLEKRITDRFHDDLIEYNNKTITDTGITITNWNETKKRMYIEKLYFLLSSKFDSF